MSKLIFGNTEYTSVSVTSGNQTLSLTGVEGKSYVVSAIGTGSNYLALTYGTTTVNLYVNDSIRLDYADSTWVKENVVNGILKAGTNVLVGTTIDPSLGKLHVVGSTYGVSSIANWNMYGASITTASTAKQMRIGMLDYPSTTPFSLIYGAVDGAQNYLNLGGGTSLGYAATAINFVTAANISTTTGTTRMTINSSGNVLVATTTDPSLGKLHVAGSISLTGAVQFTTNNFIGASTSDGSDTLAISIAGGGSASASRGAYITVFGNENGSLPGGIQIVSGNGSGSGANIDLYTYNGSSLGVRQKILAAGRHLMGPTLPTDDTVSALQVGGNVSPGTDDTYDLGTSSRRWDDVYATNGTIQTSDGRYKTTIKDKESDWKVTPFSANEVEASKQISKEIGTFQWLKSVEEKGSDARKHIGLTVQRAIEIMKANKLDPFAYGFICYDEWDELWEDARDETIEKTDEDGNIIYEEVENEDGEIEKKAKTKTIHHEKKLTRESGDRYSFRYDQLNMFIAKGIEARLSALESK